MDLMLTSAIRSGSNFDPSKVLRGKSWRPMMINVRTNIRQIKLNNIPVPAIVKIKMEAIMLTTITSRKRSIKIL
jgi:hypothetical protein